MDYLLALLLPPLAVWLCRRSLRPLLVNLVLCALVVVPGILHALWTVARCHADQRHQPRPRLGRPNPFGVMSAK